MRQGKIAAFFYSDLGLEFFEADGSRVNGQGAIEHPVGCAKITLHFIVDRKILHGPGVSGIEGDGFLQAGVGFAPFSLSPLNGAKGQINL